MGGRPGRKRADEQAAVADTPFAHVLTDFMWGQRPPWSNGTLAYKLAQAGLRFTRGGVYNWIARGRLPTLDMQRAVLDALGIPRTALLDEYARMGQTPPPALVELLTAPLAPPPADAPTQPAADEWEAMIAATVEGMRAAGVSEEAIAQVVAHIRRRQRDDATITHHVIAEHAAPVLPPPDSSVVEQRPGPSSPRTTAATS